MPLIYQQERILTKQYISTNRIAEIYDVTADFFRHRIGSTFSKDIHYIQHDKNCPIRWDVEEVERWWRGEKSLHLISKEDDELIAKLLSC